MLPTLANTLPFEGGGGGHDKLTARARPFMRLSDRLQSRFLKRCYIGGYIWEYFSGKLDSS